MNPTISSPYLQVLLAGGRAAGVHVEDLLTIGITKTSKDPHGRVAHDRAHALWDEIGRLSGDPHFGLHVAERMKPGSLAVLEYAARNAPTLGGAYELVVRYGRLVHDGADVKLTIDGDEACLSYSLPGLTSGSSRHAAEFVVGAWITVGRQITEYDFSALRVSFVHPGPEDLSEYRRVFRCAATFDAPANEMVIPTKLLSRPVIKADPTLRQLLDNYARQMLEKLPKAEDFMVKVRNLISEGLRGGDPSLEAIAKKLAMSPRTLQRRLKDADTSHQELVDAMRHDLAEKYLREPSIAIAEAAFLLGFSEPSAFHRAFKRWTGRTPGEYRRQAILH